MGCARGAVVTGLTVGVCIRFLAPRIASYRATALQRRGVLSGLLFLGYGTIRIVLEIVRNPDLAMPVFPLGLTMGMMLSVPLVTAGAFLLARRARP